MPLATQLSRIELEDAEGAAWRLGAFWRERPVVLVFVRHFG
jgi:hypothetical protein